MAIRTWIGNLTGNPATAGNWLGGNKPASGDSVFMGFQAVRDMTENLDAFSGDTWPLLFMGEDCRFSIGKPGVGNGLGTGTITKLVNQSPVAGIHISSGTITTGIINSARPLDVAAFQMDGGTVHNIKAVMGRLNFGNVTWAGDDILIVSYRNSVTADAFVQLAGDTPASIRQRGGTIEQLTTLGTSHYMEGGKVIVPVGNPGNLATLIMLNGRYNWDGSGTFTDVHLMTGVLDCTGSTIARTITNLFKHPNAEFRRSDDIVTVTNTKDMTGGDV